MQDMDKLLYFIESMIDVDTLEELLDSVDRLSEVKRTVDEALRAVKYKVSNIVGPEYGAYHLLTPNIRGIRLMLSRMEKKD